MIFIYSLASQLYHTTNHVKMEVFFQWMGGQTGRGGLPSRLSPSIGPAAWGYVLFECPQIRIFPADHMTIINPLRPMGFRVFHNSLAR